jgi:iron(III) transport system ATP-binding protein
MTAAFSIPSEPTETTPANRGRDRSVAVAVERLVKNYGAVPAVRGIDFSVPAGSTTTLLGPSGCGKTTTLRCIAGLEVPTTGHINVGGDVVFDHQSRVFVEPERRRIGMVFQSYAIWPHMTVGANVGFPLTIAGVSRADVKVRTAAILELVGLGELYDRSAADLSGGQQQRVALARALVHEPRVVLFDEPLSNLDANLRARMRTELQLLQARLGFTAIFVTHDQEEALSLSDHIVIMNLGQIEQEGSPQEVFTHPRTPFTARFLGYANTFPGRISAVEGGGSVLIEVADNMVLPARWRSSAPPRIGEQGTVAFRADRVAIARAGDAAAISGLAGEIEAVAFLGKCFDYTIRCGPLQVKAEGSVDRPFTRGQLVRLQVAPEQCHAFGAGGPAGA